MTLTDRIEPPEVSVLSDEAIVVLRRESASLRAQIDQISGEILEVDRRADGLRERRLLLQEAAARLEAVAGPGLAVVEFAPEISWAAEDAGKLKAQSPANTCIIGDVQQPVGATIADEVEAILRRAGEPLHYRAIFDQLHEQQVEIGGKDPIATLLSTLASKRYASRFVRTGRGIYALSGERVTVATRPSKRRKKKVRRVRSAGA